MIKLKTKELHFDEELNTKPTIINGFIKNIKRTNLSYIKHHRVIIKGITFSDFNYFNDIYIKNLSQKIYFVLVSTDSIEI